MLADPDERVRIKAILSLRDIGTPAKPAVESLLALLDDPSKFVRMNAVCAVGTIAGKEHTDRIAQSLFTDPEDQVRETAVYALAAADSCTVVPHLVAALRDADVDVRSAAVICLGRLGNLASSSVPSLRPLLKDKSFRSQRVSIDFSVSVPFHYDVIDALGSIGSAAQAALPDLEPFLEQEDVDTINVGARLHAAAAWIRISGDAERGLPVLKGMLTHENATVRGDALSMLNDLGERAAPLADAIMTCLHDEDVLVRTAAIRTAADIAALRGRLLPALYAALLDPDEIVVSEAISTLGPLVDTPDDAFLSAAFQASIAKREDALSDFVRAYVAEAMRVAVGPDVAISWLASQFDRGTDDEQTEVIRLIEWLDLSTVYEIRILEDLRPNAKPTAEQTLREQLEELRQCLARSREVMGVGKAAPGEPRLPGSADPDSRPASENRE